jgi:hypothetical protein
MSPARWVADMENWEEERGFFRVLSMLGLQEI